jgi:hypothetical protein
MTRRMDQYPRCRRRPSFEIGSDRSTEVLCVVVLRLASLRESVGHYRVLRIAGLRDGVARDDRDVVEVRTDATTGSG